MTSPKTIAITGGTGFVGRHVVFELLRRGYTCRVLARESSKARGAFGSPAPANVQLIHGDITDVRALSELVKGADACIHLVGIVREQRGESGDKPQSFERMHVLATAAVVEACATAGVKRYLHMSALGVGPEGRSAYQQTKWAAEQFVRRSLLDWTIFRPSLIHGPKSEFMQLMARLVEGEAPPWLFVPYFARARVDTRVPVGPVTFEPALVQPIAVEDVAFAFAQALERPDTIGEVYNLVGGETLNWRELSEFLLDTLPMAKPGKSTWYIPGEHAAAIAKLAGKVGLGSLLPFDAGQALMAMEDNAADPAKARLDLNLEPKPFRATVRRYASKV